MAGGKLSHQEDLKRSSNALEGTIAPELADSNPYVSDDSYELLKFHGTYQGYDRDTATARKQQGLEKQWEFMVRLKMPGGRLTAQQYLALDEIADVYANGTMRVTTRETFQFHGVLKDNLKPQIAAINRLLLSTLGGCGDVVRNIITCPAPIKDNRHAVLEESTYALAKYMAPKAQSYYEIWLDGEILKEYQFLPDGIGGADPLYGETYMPRKFKIAIADPEDNCMDALCNDLALLAIFDGQELKGFNVALGGGLGIKHNNPKTYPYLAVPIVFVPPQDMVAISDAVVKLQRDHGDRTDRQHARLKYVVAEKGVAWCKEALEGYMGRKLDDPRPMPPFKVVDHTGWHEQGDGKWFLGVPISSGRIVDRGEEKIRTGLREVVKQYGMRLVLTADQNIILCDIDDTQKTDITNKLKTYGIKLREDLTPVYRNMIACVALPTCGKALSEAERVKLPLVADIEKVMAKHGLLEENIAIRVAGCPNGCSRPYVGDIGIVGRTPEHYALYIGGDFEGTRLNHKIFDKVPFNDIPATLDSMFGLYREQRTGGEGFGNFCQRYGVEKVLAHAVQVLSPNYKWAK